VDGIVYAGFGAATGFLEKLQRGGLPVVVVDKPVVSKVLSSVLIDNRASVFLLLDHLRQMGHRRILFINGLTINRNAQLRAVAFQEYMHRHKLDFSDILFGDYTMQHGYQAACHALANHPGFTAVSCGDDTVACGVMAALKANGRSIPEDVAVAGFSDDPMAKLMDPPLTTICYPIAEMGRTAFDLFHRISSGTAKKPENIILETKLAVRRSTDLRCPRFPNLLPVK
jgi:DNA-binding LacI/PurR family transcriptional regulator